jgi:4-hydroxythreonine-4-phosphate dehydrogenase
VKPLALVPGEPAGVGPELCVRLAHTAHAPHLLAFADPQTLLQAAEAIGLPLRILAPDTVAEPGALALQPVPQALASTFGQPDPRNAAAVYDALHLAATACAEGRCAGLVTGPVHKATLNDAGIAYTGTTELLAQWARCDVVMMLARISHTPPAAAADTLGLRVALVTTHLPLRAVADAVTAARLTRVIEVLHGDLQRRFGIAKPRIAVLGLNPHAGEDGHLGREEIEIITPVLQRLRAQGMDLRGPLPADSAFLPEQRAQADAILAMYHDQGLAALKYEGLADAVNITLGLPYPRVAVDHGTALELAGRGVADPSSLYAAVAECRRLAASTGA